MSTQTQHADPRVTLVPGTCDGCGGTDEPAIYRGKHDRLLCATCWETEFFAPDQTTATTGTGRTSPMANLPTFEDMRRQAYRLLGDAQDELRSDWAPGTGPTSEQEKWVVEARQHIARAKDALSVAAEMGRNPR